MGPTRTFTAVACSALLLTAASSASAQTTEDRLTYVTFSGPVSIPGKTLPAGTYAFRLADSPSDRHIVQVFDREQSKLYATLLAVPADRTEAEGDPLITFKETPADRPPAVRYWYYAGERAGNEFVYPKSQAMMIARASGESVMAVDSDSADFNDWKNGKTTRVDANTEAQSSASQQPAPASQPPAMQPMTSQPTTTTQPTTTPEPTTTPAQTTTPQSSAAQQTPTTPTAATAGDNTSAVGTSGRSATSELPHTASRMPMVGLLGVFALSGALVLRVARRATV